jgi:hypothetical protein
MAKKLNIKLVLPHILRSSDHYFGSLKSEHITTHFHTTLVHVTKKI